jgi:hypothetical protein
LLEVIVKTLGREKKGEGGRRVGDKLRRTVKKKRLTKEGGVRRVGVKKG